MENVCCISLKKTTVHKGSRKNAPGKNAPRKTAHGKTAPEKVAPGKFGPPRKNTPRKIARPPLKNNFVNLPHVMEYYKGENFVSFNLRQS